MPKSKSDAEVNVAMAYAKKASLHFFAAKAFAKTSWLRLPRKIARKLLA